MQVARQNEMPIEPAASSPKRLEDLAALAPAQLLALYRGAVTPRLDELDGDFRGRMLALPALRPGRLARALRRFAAWRWFPWRGKSFRAPAAPGARGAGINRVFSDVRPRRWFRFETFIGPSRAGNFDAMHLDYDNGDNPFFIRVIQDEVRRVADGLYLGQAYVVTRKRTRLVLYFGLTTKV